METKTTTDILKTALLMERRGKAFYEKVAGNTPNAEVKKIFTLMAEEEQTHIDFLSKQFATFSKNKSFGKEQLKGPGSELAAKLILSPEIKKSISAAGFEAAAISSAIDMETKAIEVYTQWADEATDPNEKELFHWLANWEKGHHKILHQLDEELKESIWYDNQFWPF